MSIPADASAGDELTAVEVNLLRDLGFIVDQNAGETINGGTLPVAVYWDNTDDEWKACDGNDATKIQFAGFAISNSTDGNPINVQTVGRVTGFSGLTVGANYYVQDDKTIGTSVGTISIFVGVAISATEIMIKGNGAFVDLLGAQTIEGVKTFGSFPVTPSSAPSANYQVANKKYVDDEVSANKGLEYVAIVPIKNNPGDLGTTWTDWDLSGYVPAGTVYVEITICSSSGDEAGVRKNGSSIERKISGDASYQCVAFTTEVDANRVVERYSNPSGGADFILTGYWKRV